MNATNVRRKFKAGLFSKIFEGKPELLSLYNAINGSHYEDPELLEITTIEDVLYMGIKNDLSFIIDEYMNLYEAQSSWNSNMPLRGLFYFSSLYQGYVASRQLDIYSKARLMLPTPRYVVLYNGTEAEPEWTQLRLTDSFLKEGREKASVECLVEVYNINWGHNGQLMEQCRKLHEYAYLVEQVRDHLSQGMVLTAAVDRAVETCIKHGILKEFLLKHRAEVKQMILSEYDEELHIRSERELAMSEGILKGRQEGIQQGIQQGIQVLILDNLEDGTPTERILEKLQRRFDLDRETAARYLEQYSPSTNV